MNQWTNESIRRIAWPGQIARVRKDVAIRPEMEENNMEKIRELFVVVENRLGTLGELLGCLSK